VPKTQAPDRREPALFSPDRGRAGGAEKSPYPRDIRAVIYAAFEAPGSWALLAHRHCLMDLVQIPMPLSNA
jgi:hypothetical protein